MMSRHRLRLACGGLDILRASCYGSAKGEQSSPIALKMPMRDYTNSVVEKLLTETLISAKMFCKKRCYRKATVRLCYMLIKKAT